MTSCRYDVSVVMPVFNERESLGPLFERLRKVLGSMGPSEVIFVNDGSSDGTKEIIDDMVLGNRGFVKAVHLRVNSGKSTALNHGFRKVGGKMVVMMDADLQDHPEEIPKLIVYMKENNLDVVTGWKAVRRDMFLKKLLSRFFNYIMCRFSGIRVHDFNCGLKVMKRECLKNLKLYGQLHRFMMILLANKGFTVGECKVEHSSRKYGRSKYGKRRIYEGIMDFFTIFFITRYMQSPLYFFGFYGLFCFLISFLYGGFFIVLHIISIFTDYPQGNLTEHPAWLLAPVIFLIGLIFIFFGLLGELIYYLFSSRDEGDDITTEAGFEDEKNA